MVDDGPLSCVHDRAETSAVEPEPAYQSFRQLAIMAQGDPAVAHVMVYLGMDSTDIPCREEQRSQDGRPSGRITIDSWRQVIQCAVE
jgi:hypothetical protein